MFQMKAKRWLKSLIFHLMFWILADKDKYLSLQSLLNIAVSWIQIYNSIDSSSQSCISFLKNLAKTVILQLVQSKMSPEQKNVLELLCHLHKAVIKSNFTKHNKQYKRPDLFLNERKL